MVALGQSHRNTIPASGTLCRQPRRKKVFKPTHKEYTKIGDRIVCREISYYATTELTIRHVGDLSFTLHVKALLHKRYRDRFQSRYLPTCCTKRRSASSWSYDIYLLDDKAKKQCTKCQQLGELCRCKYRQIKQGRDWHAIALSVIYEDEDEEIVVVDMASITVIDKIITVEPASSEEEERSPLKRALNLIGLLGKALIGQQTPGVEVADEKFEDLNVRKERKAPQRTPEQEERDQLREQMIWLEENGYASEFLSGVQYERSHPGYFRDCDLVNEGEYLELTTPREMASQTQEDPEPESSENVAVTMYQAEKEPSSGIELSLKAIKIAETNNNNNKNDEGFVEESESALGIACLIEHGGEKTLDELLREANPPRQKYSKVDFHFSAFRRTVHIEPSITESPDDEQIEDETGDK